MQTFNKKARFNYVLLERWEAGILLSGAEVKAIRMKRADVSNSYAKIIGGEIYLVNVNIPVEGKLNYDSTRSRKLLMHKDEIVSILSKIKQKRLTLVPTKLYTRGPFIKAEIALAKPKKEFQKREAIKKKDLEREIAQEFRGKE